MNRILASHFETRQGADYSTALRQPERLPGRAPRPAPALLRSTSPRSPLRRAATALTLLLHSLGANYNQFGDSRNQSQFGERGPGSIVITPEGRGPDGWYYGHAGADTFEVWADVARRYRLDPRWTAISGYSMGGYGTYKFATQFPDLFARANPVVGPPGLGVWVPPNPPLPGGAASNTNRMLASVRNIPFLIWNGSQDELVPVAGATAQAQTFDDLGYRYTFDLFTNADHFALAVNDQYAPAADFLGTSEVDPQPAPTSPTSSTRPWTSPSAGTVADHAYWLSGLRAARLQRQRAAWDGWTPARRASARATRAVSPTQTSPGTLQGGNLGPLPYTERRRAGGPRPQATARRRAPSRRREPGRGRRPPAPRAASAATRSST